MNDVATKSEENVVYRLVWPYSTRPGWGVRSQGKIRPFFSEDPPDDVEEYDTLEEALYAAMEDAARTLRPPVPVKVTRERTYESLELISWGEVDDGGEFEVMRYNADFYDSPPVDKVNRLVPKATRFESMDDFIEYISTQGQEVYVPHNATNVPLRVVPGEVVETVEYPFE